MRAQSSVRFVRELRAGLIGVTSTKLGLAFLVIMPLSYILLCSSVLQRSLIQLAAIPQAGILDIESIRCDALVAGDGIGQLLFAFFGAAVFLQQHVSGARRLELLATPDRLLHMISKFTMIAITSTVVVVVALIVNALQTYVTLSTGHYSLQVISDSILWHLWVTPLALSSCALIGYAMASILGSWGKALFSLLSLFVFTKAIFGSALVISNNDFALAIYNLNWAFPSVGVTDKWLGPNAQMSQYINLAQLQLSPGQNLAVLLGWTVISVIAAVFVGLRRAA